MANAGQNNSGFLLVGIVKWLKMSPQNEQHWRLGKNTSKNFYKTLQTSETKLDSCIGTHNPVSNVQYKYTVHCTNTDMPSNGYF